jgi:hypothetical protein
MTIEQCIEKAAQAMQMIYTAQMEVVVERMVAAGAQPNDIAEFKDVQRQRFESWRGDQLAKLREGLLDDDGWERLQVH